MRFWSGRDNREIANEKGLLTTHLHVCSLHIMATDMQTGLDHLPLRKQKQLERIVTTLRSGFEARLENATQKAVKAGRHSEDRPVRKSCPRFVGGGYRERLYQRFRYSCCRQQRAVHR